MIEYYICIRKFTNTMNDNYSFLFVWLIRLEHFIIWWINIQDQHSEIKSVYFLKIIFIFYWRQYWCFSVLNPWEYFHFVSDSSKVRQKRPMLLLFCGQAMWIQPDHCLQRDEVIGLYDLNPQGLSFHDIQM